MAGVVPSVRDWMILCKKGIESMRSVDILESRDDIPAHFFHHPFLIFIKLPNESFGFDGTDRKWRFAKSSNKTFFFAQRINFDSINARTESAVKVRLHKPERFLCALKDKAKLCLSYWFEVFLMQATAEVNPHILTSPNDYSDRSFVWHLCSILAINIWRYRFIDTNEVEKPTRRRSTLRIAFHLIKYL